MTSQMQPKPVRSLDHNDCSWMEGNAVCTQPYGSFCSIPTYAEALKTGNCVLLENAQ